MPVDEAAAAAAAAASRQSSAIRRTRCGQRASKTSRAARRGALVEAKEHWRQAAPGGATTEQRLDDRKLEFPVINQSYAGKPYRYVYSTVPEPGWFLFNGLIKHDLETGNSSPLAFEEGCYVSEPGFAPRIGSQVEDDGYLVTFVSDMNKDQSECVIVDAQDMEAGPVARIILPHRICSGVHATWANGKYIREAEVRRVA